MQYLKIPKERIAVLIGEKGSVKKRVEKETNTRIIIEEGSVSIESIDNNSLNEWIAKDIVLGIGRGFNPEIALKLLNEEFSLELIPLRDLVNTQKAIERIKGRVIGEKGKARRVLEDITDTYVSVYGKTIAIIGSYDDVSVAKEAIIRLIEGAKHASVYRFLEKNRRQRRNFMWSSSDQILK